MTVGLILGMKVGLILAYLSDSCKFLMRCIIHYLLKLSIGCGVCQISLARSLPSNMICQIVGLTAANFPEFFLSDSCSGS